MEIKLKYQDELKEPFFKSIQQAAKELNQPAYVVGGWVRDLILDRPSKDVDIVTVGSGIELAELTAKKEKAENISVFKNFGTAMIKLTDWEVEFVGARKESYNRDSRKPIVENGTIEDDQNRRDFTINAMSISLNEADYGTLIDPFNGLLDLENKIIRTPLDPDITFSDDPLRMMRAIRFASQLDFQIHHDTLGSISKNHERIEIISMERITEELNKIMASPQPSIGLSLLFQTGLLKHFLPELCDLYGVEEKNGISHKENFYHTLEVVDNVSKVSDNVWLRYAALFHDVGKPRTKRYIKKTWTFHSHEFVGSKMIPAIFKRLRLPLDHKMKYVKKMVALSSRPIALVNEHVTDSGVRRLLFDAGDDIDDLMDLCDADVTTKNPARMKRYLDNFKVVRQKLKEVEEKDHVRQFQPPIDGNEICEIFGIKPGREIGELKKAIKEAILDGEISNNRTEAWEFLITKALELDLKPVKQPQI